MRTLIAIVVFTAPLRAQVCPQDSNTKADRVPLLNRPTVSISMDSGKVSGSMPFDERFNLSGPADSSLVAVAVRVVRSKSDTGIAISSCPGSLFNDPHATRWHRSDKKTKVFTVVVDPIAPNEQFLIRIATMTRLPDSVIRAAAHELADSILTAADQFDTLLAQYGNPATVARDTAVPGAATRVVHAIFERVSEQYSSPQKPVVTQGHARVVSFHSAYAERAPVVLRNAITDTALLNFERRYTQARLNQQGALDQLQAHFDELGPKLDTLSQAVAPFSFLLLPNDFDGGHFKSAVIFTQALPARLNREKQRIVEGRTLVESVDDTIETVGTKAIHHGSSIAPLQDHLATLGADLRYQYELFTVAARDSLVRDRLRTNVRQIQAAIVIDTALIRIVSQERETYRVLATALDSLDSAAVQYAASAVPHVRVDSLAVFGTTDQKYEDKAAIYISADIGVLAATPIFQRFSGTVIVPYVGANIYPLAVNKKAPLGDCIQMPECRIKRFSLTIGVTTSSITRGTVRTDLFGQHSLYVGVGYRMWRYLRGTAGALMYQTYSTDGTHTLQFNATPAVSLSFDWDIKGTLGGLGSVLGGG